MSYTSVLLTFGLCPYGWHAMVSLQKFSGYQRPPGCSFPSFSPWAVLRCTVPICYSRYPFCEWANPNKGGFARWSMWSEEKIFSKTMQSIFSRSRKKKGELLFIEGRDSNRAQHNCLLGFGGSFYFCPFSSSSMEGHMLLLLSVQDAFGVNDNLWKQTLAFQTWTKVSDAAGSNSHTSNHSLICEALE